MISCKNCGASNENDALCCSVCGRLLEKDSDDLTNSYSPASSGWWFLGFMFWILGFIVAGCVERNMPDAADKLRNGAKVGLIINIIITVIRFFIALYKL